MGKVALMTGVATIAMLSVANAKVSATDSDASQPVTGSDKPVVLAQNYTPANGSGMSNAELAARLQALEDEMAARSDRDAATRTRLATLEQGYNSAVWSFDNGRPTFASGDGRFTLAIRARFQADFGGFSQDQHPAPFAGPSDLSSGAVIRRAYFGIEGKAYSDFSYEIRLNAGGSDGGNFGASGVPNGGEGDPLLNKAVITYTGIPNWHFNVGVLEPALMMEGTTSSASLMFLERPEIENIAADSFGAGDSRRGVEVGWAKTDTFWSGDNVTATATFSGNKTGSAAGHGSASGVGVSGGGDEQTQILGRVTDRIWSEGLSNLQIGVSLASILDSGQVGNVDGGSQTIRFRDRPEIRVDGTRLIDTGGIAAKTGDMMAFDIEGNWNNFYLGGEWAQFNMDRQCGSLIAARCGNSADVADHPSFSGWTVEGSWILTGETKVYSPSAINNEVGGYNMPVPSRPFSLSGDSWGAWELVARYSVTDLNWHANQAAVTGVSGVTDGILAGIDGGKEKVIALGVNWYMNRNIRMMIDDNIVAVQKGVVAGNLNRDDQDINIVGVRLQYAN